MVTAIALAHVENSFRFGFNKKRKIIHDLSLTVSKGEVFGFIGPNGAGKSTVINLLLGFIKADKGKVTINDKLPENPESRLDIGFLPEGPRFYNHLTAEELLTFGGLASGFSHEKIHTAIDPLLDRLEILHVKKQPVSTYSKGMKQRIGLALAMVHDPEIYILDEPMSGLDPLGRKLLKNIILEEKQKGKTIFFSSHILNDIEILCDRVGIIDKGRMVYCGALQEFCNNGKDFEECFVDLIMKQPRKINTDE